jgi:phage terminase small subunit
MPGPAKQSPRLKLLRGTLQPKDRDAPAPPELPAFDAVPSPPEWLTDAEAIREWHRLAPVLTAHRLLSAGNIGLLAQLCAVHGHLVRVWRAGKANAALVATYRTLSNSLGLLSMNLSAPSKGNRFAAYAARRPQG